MQQQFEEQSRLQCHHRRRRLGLDDGGQASGGGDIVVEGLAQLAFYPGIDTAFQARITRFNNAGGLNGRKIKFLGVQDTGTDPAKAMSETQSIVLKDHVFAVAPVASEVVLAPVSDFLTKTTSPTSAGPCPPTGATTTTPSVSMDA